jgi:putative tricarboxylic transport membrane protein
MVPRLRKVAPFAFTAVVGLYFWFLAGEIDPAMSAGRVGPAAWPRIILALLLGAALLGVIQATLRPADLDRSLGGSITNEPSGAGEAAETRPSNLRAMAGIAVLAAFPVAIPWLGFLVTSVLVIFGQMWIGGYRKPVRAGVIALVGTLVLFLIFQRFVYLSLPLGAGPFAEFTMFVMSRLGVR